MLPRAASTGYVPYSHPSRSQWTKLAVETMGVLFRCCEDGHFYEGDLVHQRGDLTQQWHSTPVLSLTIGLSANSWYAILAFGLGLNQKSLAEHVVGPIHRR